MPRSNTKCSEKTCANVINPNSLWYQKSIRNGNTNGLCKKCFNMENMKKDMAKHQEEIEKRKHEKEDMLKESWGDL